jgi:hypothetical protein
MWNHFDNKYERTNNRVEGDNNKMKVFCGASNPNIDKAVRLLQQYEATASDKYTNAKKATAKAPYQEPEIQRREANFKLVKSLLQTGGLELKVYLDQVVDLHTFQPKKKYTEDLDDTDISDESDAEDDSDDEQATVITHQIDGMTIQ